MLLAPCPLACLISAVRSDFLRVSHRESLVAWRGRLSHLAASCPQCSTRETGSGGVGCCGYPEGISSKVSDQLAQP